MFMALDIDRYNLANATADNFLGDLGVTQADYNLGNTLSKVGFLVRSARCYRDAADHSLHFLDFDRRPNSLRNWSASVWVPIDGSQCRWLGSVPLQLASSG